MFAGSVQAAAGCHGLIKPNYRCHKPELAPTRLGSPASPSADTATPHCPPPLQPAVRLTKWEMKNPINILRGPAIPADSPRQVKGFTAWRELLVSLRMHIYGASAALKNRRRWRRGEAVSVAGPSPGGTRQRRGGCSSGPGLLQGQGLPRLPYYFYLRRRRRHDSVRARLIQQLRRPADDEMVLSARKSCERGPRLRKAPVLSGELAHSYANGRPDRHRWHPTLTCRGNGIKWRR